MYAVVFTFQNNAWAGLLAGRLEKLDPEGVVDTEGGGGFNPRTMPKNQRGL
jgi:hypothetical protein